MIPTTVDDSKYNRLGPDPDALKLAGIKTVALSATPDGFGLMNIYFPERVERYVSAGLKVEAFHTWYEYPDPRDQIEAFRLALKYAGWDKRWRVWNDIERAGLPIIRTSAATDSAWKVTQGIIALGLTVGVYTSKYMWESKVRIVRGRYPWQNLALWTAHWNELVKSPLLPYPWTTWDRWQYKGDIVMFGQDGIDLNVDREA
jgi:GH25 family lysozyme M1 (1,4-beta-N-acetylmuramidase)